MASFFICPSMSRFPPIFLFACSLVLTFFCYQAGLQGTFLFDDTVNIVDNGALRIQSLDMVSLKAAAFSMANGLSARPISMLSFAVNHYFGDLVPYGFKLTNLAIHLLNGVCIFILTQLILGALRRRHASLLSFDQLRWISLATASFWMLHPFNLTGVLYVVQRMASLSTLFTLLGLITYLYGRVRQLDGKPGWGWMFSSFFVFTPLAVLSKENGALLPAFVLLMELVLLNFQGTTPKSGAALKALFTATVILPVIAAIIYSIINPTWLLEGYNLRDFTLTERLMTEARVVWFYLQMTLLPNIAAMGFYHDDFVISTGLLTPPSTLFSISGLLGLLIAALLWRKTQPVLALGILFFLLGHSMESSVIPLELVHEHRNYLPMFGVVLPVAYYMLSPEHHPASLRMRKVGVVLVVIMFAALTWLRASQWSDPFGLMQMEVQHHPQSARANADLASQYAYLPASNALDADLNYRNALAHFSQAAYISKNDTAGFFGVLAINSARGLPTDATWTDELEKRLERMPSLPSSINSLMALEKCYVAGRCKHGPELMERLLRAALRNPTLTGPRRSTALFALSDFLFKINHQPEQAAEAAYQAVAAAPTDMGQRLTLIVFLVNMGKLDKADMEITKTRNMNTHGTYTLALTQLEQQLARVRAQSSSQAK